MTLALDHLVIAAASLDAGAPVGSALAWLGADGLIEVEAGEAPSLRAGIETPQGIRTLR